MAKAPRRPVSKPAESGALPRRHSARDARGVFCKAGADEARDASDHERSAAPKPPARRKRTGNNTPAQLVKRVTRAIDSELSQIEEIMNGARVSSARRTEGEKRARTLASLARTLAEVTKLREGAKEARADHDDEAVPRDLDEFRRTLERRLAEMADRQARAPDRGHEPDGDGMA